MLLSAIFVAAIICFLTVVIDALLTDGATCVSSNGKEYEHKKSKSFGEFLGTVDQDMWAKAIIFGVMAGAIIYLAPKTGTIIAVVLYAVAIGLMFYYFSWWKAEGSAFKEFIFFLVIQIVLYYVAMAPGAIIASALGGGFFSKLVSFAPGFIRGFICWYMVISILYYRYEQSQKTRNEEKIKKGKTSRLIGRILFVLAIIILLLSLFSLFKLAGPIDFEFDASSIIKTDLSLPQILQKGGIEVPSAEEEALPSESIDFAPADTSQAWYYFYNTEVLKDNDKNNDFNFGPNPYNKGEVASYYDASFRNRMRLDPALAAADMAWLDAIVGTRYMGSFYEECKGEWASTINTAKVKFMEDKTLFDKTLEAYFAFLNSATSVELRYVDAGLEDQMYMNGYTVDGVPDVIVMKTTDHDGWFLTYTFVIKGQKFEVSYRIDCGYQPTNVEKVMNIKPQPKPTPTPTPTPGPGPGPTPTPTPTPTPGPTPTPTPTPTPGPTPTPTPTDPIKDPTEGTDVGGNDNPGPGESTNTGVGSNTSAADQPTNSDHMTHEEYVETIQELHDINEEQHVGGDPNTPTVETPPDTHVDNNGDNGTGNGGIDVPTPVSEPVHIESPSGEQSSISEEPAGEAWDGPPD